MAFIEVIDYDASQGELREIYDDLFKKRGQLANVHMIQSLNTESIVSYVDLYLTVMFGKAPLSRPQLELIAVIVSKNNNCQYCIKHHAEALNHYWKNQDKIDALIDDFESLELSETNKLLCEFARLQTINPKADEEMILRLKKAGADDRAILDATLVIAYFNFVNRIVLAFGLELEENKVYNYKY